MIKCKIKCIVTCFFVIASGLYCAAQNVPIKLHPNLQYDSSYYNSFINDIVARFYFSQKFTGSFIQGIAKRDKLKYWPNTNLNMGVGATYKPLTINLGFGFNFLNRDKEKGKTKYLDLQSHVYLRKWMFDVLGQFYRSYYLLPKDLVAPESGKYYIRPDMRVRLVGVSAYKIFNYDKFSYRAAMVQNEWQKKSAGSFIAGAEINYGSQKADSAFVPYKVENKFNQKGVNKIIFFQLGPAIGYAHTFVVDKHFFITASLTGNPKISIATEHKNHNVKTHVSVVPGYVGRGAIGYNSEIWNINASFVFSRIITKGASSADHYAFTTSNVRLTYARHFVPNHKLRKKLNAFDRVFKKNIPLPMGN